MSAADPTTERYAAIMDSLISDCTRLEDRVAELETQLRATAQARDAAIAAQTAAERERDHPNNRAAQALTSTWHRCEWHLCGPSCQARWRHVLRPHSVACLGDDTATSPSRWHTHARADVL